nr:anaphase-promoting complex subunit 1 [Ipomoea batatas]
MSKLQTGKRIRRADVIFRRLTGRRGGHVRRHLNIRGTGYPLGGGVSRHEKHGHVGGGDDGVDPLHRKHNINVAELQILVGGEGGESPPHVQRPGVDQEIGGVFQHELRRLHRLSELPNFAAGKDNPSCLYSILFLLFCQSLKSKEGFIDIEREMQALSCVRLDHVTY